MQLHRAILWKVDAAVNPGRAGLSCTDVAARQNKDTKRGVEPFLLDRMHFKLKRRCVDAAQESPRQGPLLVVMNKNQVETLHENSLFPGLFNIPTRFFINTNYCCCAFYPLDVTVPY